MGDTRVVTVEIGGLRYPIRSELPEDYVQALASYVDAKLQAAADDTEAGDSMKVAIVTALNIADELFRSRDATDTPGPSVRMRVEALEHLVEAALAAGAPLATPPGSD
ncbi:MAG: cell division protein ZapA [Acidobacteria bacterium]|nr:cell division protein ZapA [Acidobacteriota bacterium]